MRYALLLLLLASPAIAEDCTRTFNAAPYYTMSGAVPFVAADLDADGRSEILMRGDSGKLVAAHYANGGFDERQTIAELPFGLTDVVVTDIDDNGRIDFVALLAQGLVSI
ncbi:MAG TPA: VCBS repeat-containing protein, partial [Thermoanaerobaculia bacterium]|nr:VCBS repeat-containing protein [Thermoanaerobaculia bacterium]